jgi:hypothetical protein
VSTAHDWWVALGAALGVARAGTGTPTHLALAVTLHGAADSPYVRSVLDRVRALEGVAVVRWSPAEGRMDIGYDASLVSSERLLFAVHAIEPSAHPWPLHPGPCEARGRDACC